MERVIKEMDEAIRKLYMRGRVMKITTEMVDEDHVVVRGVVDVGHEVEHIDTVIVIPRYK